MEKASIYIHIPFCLTKCRYCDFCSYVGYSDAAQKIYMDEVIAEAYRRKNELKGKAIDTIFIGGGTPSVLAIGEIKRLVDNLVAIFDLSQLTEFTIEVNPNSLTQEKLAEFSLCGVTRISIGVQSFNDRFLRILGRGHDRKQAISAVAAAVQIGFDVSIDMMIGLPGQTLDDIADDVSAALALHVAHVSCYSLIVEENTPIEHDIASGVLVLPGDDYAADCYAYVSERLQKSGLNAYEVSNFGKPCLHNLGYWKLKDYLGLGISAHSYTMGIRRYNLASMTDYLTQKAPIVDEVMTNRDFVTEAIMLGLRLTDGLQISTLQSRLNHSQYRLLVAIFSSFSQYLDVDGGYVRLKWQHVYVMNSILCLVLEEVDKLWN